MNIKNLVEQFESLVLPISDWNHSTHLRIALWYIYHEPDLYKAIQKIKCGWIRYGTHKPLSVCHDRYHETITVFWAHQIKVLIEENPNRDIIELDTLITEDRRILQHTKHILKFYPVSMLTSTKARSIFTPPSTLRYYIFKYNQPTIQPVLTTCFILFILFCMVGGFFFSEQLSDGSENYVQYYW